ncbi:hypothetical protein L6452_02920 [Arctium lappa]|uniref:Uncharacterized protein n=1 Tax=Arctium lappa TaxID=4217 RepID=A0ACB9FLS6_ARCLA|nr:hypothetical protein L6452_02920 [Arctium lappa]
MAQHVSGEQYVKEGHHSTDEYTHNPLQSATGGHQIGTIVGTHGHEQAGKHDGGILHLWEWQFQLRGKKKEEERCGGKIKEKLPGGDQCGADEQKPSVISVAPMSRSLNHHHW